MKEGVLPTNPMKNDTGVKLKNDPKLWFHGALSSIFVINFYNKLSLIQFLKKKSKKKKECVFLPSTRPYRYHT
jgi:hypothetical protein